MTIDNAGMKEVMEATRELFKAHQDALFSIEKRVVDLEAKLLQLETKSVIADHQELVMTQIDDLKSKIFSKEKT